MKLLTKRSPVTGLTAAAAGERGWDLGEAVAFGAELVDKAGEDVGDVEIAVGGAGGVVVDGDRGGHWS